MGAHVYIHGRLNEGRIDLANTLNANLKSSIVHTVLDISLVYTEFTIVFISIIYRGVNDLI